MFSNMEYDGKVGEENVFTFTALTAFIAFSLQHAINIKITTQVTVKQAITSTS